MIGPRVAVVGTTGSGKTTLARQLAQRYQLPVIELDALHWQEGWQEEDLDTFCQQVANATSGSTWITDGNYSKVRHLIWPRATTLIWLDYPLPVILWQLLRRTLGRVLRREVLWNNNRETLRGAFLDRDSLFRWALTSHPRQRKTYPALLARPEHAHLHVIHLRSRTETKQFLASLKRPSSQRGTGGHLTHLF